MSAVTRAAGTETCLAAQGCSYISIRAVHYGDGEHGVMDKDRLKKEKAANQKLLKLHVASSTATGRAG